MIIVGFFLYFFTVDAFVGSADFNMNAYTFTLVCVYTYLRLL